MSVKKTQLCDGVEGVFIENSRFSTTRISFNFYMPLEKEKVAARGLLPFLLTTCSQKYPDFSKLNYKLNKLYGASLEASTEKIGDIQLLKITISVIDDKYALDNEPLCELACELLLRLIFEPKVLDGSFYEEDVEREKRKAIEHIRGEIAEKRIYAKRRLIEEMYKDSPYGISKCGKESDVAALSGKELFDCWRELIESAFIRINVISSALPNNLFQNISNRFSIIERKNITDCKRHSKTKACDKINEVTERLDVNQGKLVMGFSSEVCGNDKKTAALVVMTDIFGGGPYSRLFTNVREKLSLCYYCAASSVRLKGLLTVDSGVEEKNAKKAQKEILNQLEIIKQDKFSDFEFTSSKKAITDSMHSVSDRQSAIDTWYSVKIADDEIITPEDYAALISKVTRKQVVKAANGIKPHTIYKLLPKE